MFRPQMTSKLLIQILEQLEQCKNKFASSGLMPYPCCLAFPPDLKIGFAEHPFGDRHWFVDSW